MVGNQMYKVMAQIWVVQKSEKVFSFFLDRSYWN